MKCCVTLLVQGEMSTLCFWEDAPPPEVGQLIRYFAPRTGDQRWLRVAEVAMRLDHSIASSVSIVPHYRVLLRRVSDPEDRAWI